MAANLALCPSHKSELISTDTAHTSLLFIHTHTQIILVCVKIKFNSSFKGQAHQKWEPGKKNNNNNNNNNCHQVWRPKKKNPKRSYGFASRLSFSEDDASSCLSFSLLTCSVLWGWFRERGGITTKLGVGCERQQIKAWMQTSYFDAEWRQFSSHRLCRYVSLMAPNVKTPMASGCSGPKNKLRNYNQNIY